MDHGGSSRRTSSDNQLLAYETCATPTHPIYYTPDDRHKDVASFQLILDRMNLLMTISLWLTWLLCFALFVVPTTYLQTFAIPCGVVMMGLWSAGIMLMTAASKRSTTINRTTVWHVRTSMLTSILLVVFAVMPLFCSYGTLSVIIMRPVRAALALVIAVLQIGLLLWTLRTGPSAEIELLHGAFYATLKSVCCIATTESLAFLWKSFLLDSSPTWSFACTMACLLSFACGTFVATLVMSGPLRGTWNEHTELFSSDAVSDYAYESKTCNGCCKALLPIAIYLCVAISFVLVWPSFDGYDWIVAIWYPIAMALVLCGLERHFLAACRFHILPNASLSIVVQTMSKLYVYDQVLHAEVEPTMNGAIPAHTETCHVYCAKSTAVRVKIQLSRERLLYLTPKHPAEFANIIKSAI